MYGSLDLTRQELDEKLKKFRDDLDDDRRKEFVLLVDAVGAYVANYILDYVADKTKGGAA